MCRGYGHAVCHADVCDDCRIKFYDEMGEEIVNCRGKIIISTDSLKHANLRFKRKIKDKNQLTHH